MQRTAKASTFWLENSNNSTVVLWSNTSWFIVPQNSCHEVCKHSKVFHRQRCKSADGYIRGWEKMNHLHSYRASVPRLQMPPSVTRYCFIFSSRQLVMLFQFATPTFWCSTQRFPTAHLTIAKKMLLLSHFLQVPKPQLRTWVEKVTFSLSLSQMMMSSK